MLTAKLAEFNQMQNQLSEISHQLAETERENIRLKNEILNLGSALDESVRNKPRNDSNFEKRKLMAKISQLKIQIAKHKTNKWIRSDKKSCPFNNDDFRFSEHSSVKDFKRLIQQFCSIDRCPLNSMLQSLIKKLIAKTIQKFHVETKLVVTCYDSLQHRTCCDWFIGLAENKE